MGLLKIAIHYLDYLVTLVAGWLLMDMLYQFAMHSLLSVDSSWDAMGLVTSFRPDLHKYKLAFMVAKRAYLYFSN